MPSLPLSFLPLILLPSLPTSLSCSFLPSISSPLFFPTTHPPFANVHPSLSFYPSLDPAVHPFLPPSLPPQLLFNSQLHIHTWLLAMQCIIVAFEIVVLLRVTYWYQILSISVFLLFNYFILHKLLYNRLMFSKLKLPGQ